MWHDDDREDDDLDKALADFLEDLARQVRLDRLIWAHDELRLTLAVWFSAVGFAFGDTAFAPTPMAGWPCPGPRLDPAEQARLRALWPMVRLQASHEAFIIWQLEQARRESVRLR